MPLWTLLGLMSGNQSLPWPLSDGDDGQANVLGMPRYRPDLCTEECQACVDVCPTGAISMSGNLPTRLDVDYGRCVVCQLCTEACPEGAMEPSNDWAFGVRRRTDLKWSEKGADPAPAAQTSGFHRSLHIRHVDAGSCNGCESELQALNNPLYNLHRLGIFFTASPRAADLLLVTGPVTQAMREPLLATYEAMPDPRWVMAVGTCAVSGGCTAAHGLEGILPVDVWLPGCPPNPSAIIHALMMFLGRAQQQIRGGHLE